MPQNLLDDQFQRELKLKNNYHKLPRIFIAGAFMCLLLWFGLRFYCFPLDFGIDDNSRYMPLVSKEMFFLYLCPTYLFGFASIFFIITCQLIEQLKDWTLFNLIKNFYFVFRKKSFGGKIKKVSGLTIVLVYYFFLLCYTILITEFTKLSGRLICLVFNIEKGLFPVADISLAISTVSLFLIGYYISKKKMKTFDRK